MKISQTTETMVFNPTGKELADIVPEGNKVRINRVGTYDWMFGTKKFMFMKDQQGNVYAKTDHKQMLFDDFVGLNEITEMRKSINTDIRNATFSEDDRDMAEADYALVGHEFDRAQESDSTLDQKIKSSNRFN